ncbi:MAG: sensor histidine kinase, partial [Deltaproteobacteria bacterium]|nr:sensor histidine kinase [Deltaproteobacteria bacterium]
EQVFLNLFINAIQAMPDGGTITINAFREASDYIKIDIKDSGVGIKPEQLEHIFEPFYTTKSVGRGTGLGLAVSYALVKKHGGYIEVKSKVNVGTTFSIYLPIKSGSE